MTNSWFKLIQRRAWRSCRQLFFTLNSPLRTRLTLECNLLEAQWAAGTITKAGYQRYWQILYYFGEASVYVLTPAVHDELIRVTNQQLILNQLSAQKHLPDAL